MNKYRELKAKQEKRIHALPIKFAFNREQFKEAMEALGLTENDTDKIYKLGNTGGYYRRTDSQKIRDAFTQSTVEITAAINADVDGTGFIKDMFLYELANHEYCITYDLEPTLDALGLTLEEVNAKPNLRRGLQLAKKEYLKSIKDY